VGDERFAVLVNRFLEPVEVRALSPATVRAHAFDLADFEAFLADRALDVEDVAAVDVFADLDWQGWCR